MLCAIAAVMGVCAASAAAAASAATASASAAAACCRCRFWHLMPLPQRLFSGDASFAADVCGCSLAFDAAAAAAAAAIWRLMLLLLLLRLF